ncbi:MAG: hypothetical protein HQK52_05655 [Oligoflexia bacterium]|nr:hypothetical protein [Oligoflexia bacterium]
MVSFTKIEKATLDPQVLEYTPIACIDCHFEGEIPMDYYLVEPPSDGSDKDYREFISALNDQLGHRSFEDILDYPTGDLISVARCPKCGSEELFYDYD